MRSMIEDNNIRSVSLTEYARCAELEGAACGFGRLLC